MSGLLLSAQENSKKDGFYFSFSSPLKKFSFVGTVDKNLQKMRIKNITPYIADDVFSIVEQFDNKGYLITTLTNKYFTDSSFNNIKIFASELQINQVNQIQQFNDKYLVIGDKLLGSTPSKTQRDIGVVLINKDLTIKKEVRVGMSYENDTISKNAINSLHIINNNQFLVSGITFLDFNKSAFPYTWHFVSMLDSNLNIKFTKYYKEIAYNLPLSIIGAQDNSILICGTRTYPQEKSRAFVTKEKISNILSDSEEIHITNE